MVIPVATGIVIGWFNLLGTLDMSNGWYWRHIFSRMLLSVFPGGWLTEASWPASNFHGEPSRLLDFLGVANAYGALASPNLWIGVALGAAMIAGAIWFRRWRDDS